MGTAKQETKEERMKRAGWKTGTVGEFLGIPPEEAQLTQTKAALGDECESSPVTLGH